MQQNASEVVKNEIPTSLLNLCKGDDVFFLE